MRARPGAVTFIGASVLLAFAVSAATYIEYRSFDPCAWMVQDMIEESGLPPIAAQARARSRFLAEGIVRPDTGQCVLEWWAFRSETASGGS